MYDYNIQLFHFKKINKDMCVFMYFYIHIQYFHKDINEGITLVAYMKKNQLAEKHWF